MLSDIKVNILIIKLNIANLSRQTERIKRMNVTYSIDFKAKISELKYSQNNLNRILSIIRKESMAIR